MEEISSYKKRNVLVLFSGGQDSTTCLYWAKKHFNEVYALSIRYGQIHENEVECARSIAAEAGVSFDVIDAGLISSLSHSCSLTSRAIEMDKDVDAGNIPNTFVPGRNLFFLSIAAVYALDHGIYDLVTGVSMTDYSGYPDCRDSFIRSLNVTLNLALESQFVIHTPLMWLDKSETWGLADMLGVYDLVRTRTLTCYKGIVGDGCGECPACRLRRRGLENYLRKKEDQLH